MGIVGGGRCEYEVTLHFVLYTAYIAKRLALRKKARMEIRLPSPK